MIGRGGGGGGGDIPLLSNRSLVRGTDSPFGVVVAVRRRHRSNIIERCVASHGVVPPIARARERSCVACPASDQSG
jgi:hypothetical protein